MNAITQRLQMNAGPQRLQMNARPQRLQMNAKTQHLQMNARPQRSQMNVGPHLVGIFLFEDTTILPRNFLVGMPQTMLGSTFTDTTIHTGIHP